MISAAHVADLKEHIHRENHRSTFLFFSFAVFLIIVDSIIHLKQLYLDCGRFNRSFEMSWQEY